ALELDAGCAPARAMLLDLVVDDDASVLASALESAAQSVVSDQARGRFYLASAWVWAVFANDVCGA
ncbi:MAG: hypothetical protein FWD57_06490, partial [Polyangiaceae bacterium]|nr:hypothetical protein [Polyangiaceae bacterium]